MEKEAFSIIRTCRRADYLLHRPCGFDLYTDQRNLRSISDPHSVLSLVSKYTADKLQRWALLLIGYENRIHDIAGNTNVWANILSRWGCSLPKSCAIMRLQPPSSPALDYKFVWPTEREIRTGQKRAKMTA